MNTIIQILFFISLLIDIYLNWNEIKEYHHRFEYGEIR